MGKISAVAATASLMVLALTMPVFAGEWKQEEAGWQYQNDDGSYPNNGWEWVDGRCYYFTSEGYCLTDTQTPDGYTVDAGGAWVIDGVVQTQETVQNGKGTATVQMDYMTFTLPDGFEQDTSLQGGIFLVNKETASMIAYVSETIPDMGEEQEMIHSIQQLLLDAVMQELIGTPDGKESVQFGTGKWYRYDYSEASYLGMPGSMSIYARIEGNDTQIMVFAGYLTGMDTDAVMGNNLK